VNTLDIPLLRGTLRLRSDGYLPQAPEVDFDAIVEERDLTPQAVAELGILEPYGEANQRPLFVLTGQTIVSTRTFGDGKHLRIGLLSGIEAVMWDGGEEARHLPQGKLDILFDPRLSAWDGETRLQLHIRDIRPTGRPYADSIRVAHDSGAPVRAASIPPVDPETLGNYLMISGRNVVYVSAGEYPEPDGTATDYILTAPPTDPEALRDALMKAGSGSRVMCAFRDSAFAELEKEAQLMAPDRETLVQCHRMIAEASTAGMSLEEYGRRIETVLGLSGHTALTLARSSATIFTELGFVRQRGLRLFIIAGAAKRDLTESLHLRNARASLELLLRTHDKIGRSPVLLAEWLAGDIEPR
jgi:single-stranded-DNA-specific exonuclease